MNRLFKIILFLIVIGVAAYQFDSTARARLEPFVDLAYEKISEIFVAEPCAEPIKYDLARFDGEFGISKAYFLSAMEDAETIWEKPLGKNLFSYAPQKGRLKVNLVYDYRQQATNKLKSLGITVKDDQASYDSLKAKYLLIEKQYETIKATYEAQVAAFNRRSAAYEQQVEYWNARGGAPREKFEELMAEQSALESEAAQLKTTQTKMNDMVDEINALVVTLNRLANTLNLAVNQYNTIGASRGESFEEGLYESNASGQKIDIYEFRNRDELVRVLAHELGHALGLGHVSDPKAIMYSFNSSTNSTLTKDDISAFKARCGIK